MTARFTRRSVAPAAALIGQPATAGARIAPRMAIATGTTGTVSYAFGGVLANNLSRGIQG